MLQFFLIDGQSAQHAISFSDQVVLVTNHPPIQADTLTISDTVSPAGSIFNASFTDTVIFTDAIAVIIKDQYVLSQTIALFDAVVNNAKNLSVLHTISFSDALARTNIFREAMVDAIAFGQLALEGNKIVLVDTIQFTQSALNPSLHNEAIESELIVTHSLDSNFRVDQQALTIRDVATLVGTYNLTVIDPIGIAQSVLIPISEVLTQTISFAYALDGGTRLYQQVVDALSFIDLAAGSAGAPSASTINLGQTVLAVLDRNLSLTDTIGFKQSAVGYELTGSGSCCV